ncbi:cache domain-containing protein [Massilia sp. W12]|uniref:cache domain-containing protein n=1 Tax=Massilia sp. W12 TaxID=3126507 RepID=UPI0030D40593
MKALSTICTLLLCLSASLPTHAVSSGGAGGPMPRIVNGQAVAPSTPPDLKQARRNEQQAQAMVQKVIAYLREHGPDKTIAEINSPHGPFRDGELYVFLFDGRKEAFCLAHGAYPNLIGKDLRHIRDPDGVLPAIEIMKVGKSRTGRGWVDYRWPHPISHKIEKKRTYVERHGNYVLGAGITREH